MKTYSVILGALSLIGLVACGAKPNFSRIGEPHEKTPIEIVLDSEGLYGDLNMDGDVNDRDLVILSDYLVGNLRPNRRVGPFRAELRMADLDQNGAVNAVDLVILENYLTGNIETLPLSN